MKRKYKTTINEKVLTVSLKQLKNISLIIRKINALGKKIGSGHDSQILKENEDGSYTLILVSYYGGPTWNFNFDLENEI